MSTWIYPLIATILFYGLAQALTKQMMANLTSSAFIILYIGCKLVINVGAYLALSHTSVFDPTLRQFMIWACVANVFNALAWLFYYKALEKGPVSIVGTVVAAFPVVTVLLMGALAMANQLSGSSWPMVGEKLAYYQYIGVALAILGGVLVSYQPDTAETPAADRGRGWLVSALLVFFFWGITMVAIKYSYTRATYSADLDYAFLIANTAMVTLILAPYGLLTLEGGMGARRDILLALVPTILFCVGDVALFWAAAQGPVSIVTPLQGSYPLITIFYAVLFMKERMMPTQQAGLGIIMGAILLISLVKDAQGNFPMWILVLSLLCITAGFLLLLRAFIRPARPAPADIGS